MISPRILPLTMLFILAIFTGSTRAQTTKTDENAALREKAFALLESVGGQLGTLQSAENRARLGANIADSLWPHNEKLARSILFQVEADIRTELQKWQPKTGNDRTLLVFLKLRADTVERIAKRDAEAALAFLKGTELKSEDLPKYTSQHFEGLETRLALRIAAVSPDAALKLSREVLAQGFHYDLLTLLRRLNRKHRESAQELYRDMVSKLQNANLITNGNARYFARSLAYSFQPPAADAAVYRELISMFVTTALKNGCGDKIADEDFRGNYCRWLGSEMPSLERFDSRAARLRHWAQNNGQDVFEESVVLQELSDLLDEGTTDEILAAASKYPARAEMIYRRLIDRARQAGDLDQARKITSTYITDPETRKSILARLENHEKTVASNPTLAEIEEQLNTIQQPQQRIEYLFMSAHRLGASDQKAALKLLDRAGNLIDTLKPGKEQAQGQLTLAVLYCYEKSERGMGLMESLVPRLNELVDVAARLDGFETNYLRDGEWNMSASGGVGEILTRLSQMAGGFAWFDFDRAVSLASRFDRGEIRMMAHIRLAQSILAGPPKRIPAGRGRH
jgi:hypothetical protein